MARSNSKTSSSSKKSQNDSAASSPDITSRGPLSLNNNIHNNNNNGPIAATMSETSDDSSLNSVDLDPIGKLIFFFEFPFFVDIKNIFAVETKSILTFNLFASVSEYRCGSHIYR